MNTGWHRGVAALPLLILLAGASMARAQGAQGNATLTGTVVDNVGVIPAANVTATHQETSTTRTTLTNEQGEFRLVSLPPGRYVVKIDMDGFRPLTVAEFTLLAGEVRSLGRLTLVAGGVTESVTVTAEVTPVQTNNSALSRNVTGDTLTTVQVKGRDIFGIMKILPGVVDTNLNRDFASWSSAQGLSVNGGQPLNKNTMIDGVPVGEEGCCGSTFIVPNIDAIGEMNVITSGYNAEHGRNNSGVVQLTTKSGTNEFRGSAWYNARRDEWNKNDYFRIKSGDPKPFFEVNISGYSFGGPVIIPKVMDSRTSPRKLYFFLSQEFTDDQRPSSVVRTNLPTELERRGDFSQTRFGSSEAGTLQTLANPFSDRPDLFIAPNVINPKYIDPMGAALLNLLPAPNLIPDLRQGQRWTSNDTRDQTPEHTRKNFILRLDTVLNASARGSFRVLRDRDNSITYNRVAPGIGSVNNHFPGNLYSGAFTKVISPTIVNETTIGYSLNHYGFRVGTGTLDAEDYTQFYQQNVVNPITGETGLFPPRFEAFGAYGEPHLTKGQLDEYPYLPNLTFSGGDRTNLAQYRPSGGNGPIPRENENSRWTFQNDLSLMRGRHNFKFGVFIENDSKTEPGSSNYAGTYAFGHSSTNPLSTGNGYANALLGIFDQYSELNNRVDRDNRHWTSDAYAQDSWRVSSNLTLDIGVRVTHAGAVYEVNDQNSGFFPELWDASAPALLYQPVCRTGATGLASCPSSQRAAIDPRFPGVFLPYAYQGSFVIGSGYNLENGIVAGGVDGKKDGWYYDMPFLSWAPRFGFAWDVFGDGKTAIRGGTGVFINFINRAQYLWNGGPAISRERSIRSASIADVADVAATGQFLEAPVAAGLVDGVRQTPETNYQANLAFQRDIGFNTVAEVAWSANYGYKFWRSKGINNPAPYAFANPANLFNGEAINQNFLRRAYPGMGQINQLTTDEETLNYNALSITLQRRLSRGLQMGLAYTLAKGEGLRGWDYLTEELFGEDGVYERYWGPTDIDRRHILVLNYSYMVPNPTPRTPVLKHVLNNWEASGVTQFTTGAPFEPECNTNISGIQNADPSFSGVGIRCELTGEPIFSGYTVDGSLAEEDQAHFNLAAFRRPAGDLASGVGNLGNSPIGVLRHPSWWNWDFTLERRIPVTVGRGGSVRLQFQLYNMWNAVQFRTLAATYTFSASGNTNVNTGKYTQTTNPLNAGVTLRFDY